MGSWSQTIMKDQRLVLEEAQIVAAPESVLTVALPGSVAIAEGASVGDVLIKEYTPEVRQTVSELIETVQLVSQETIPVLVGTFGEAIALQAQTSKEVSMQTTEFLGQKLQETQLGQAAILPGVAKYMLIAVAVIVVAGKVLK